ncbi:MAG: dihydrofolate reductase [Bacteroidales bacterium]|nr:dihydrofolate reductase [Bacteroidales bacterium]
MISIIVAIAQENAIGRNNQLLCHLSDDLKRFKRLTSGHTVIMGRNTFDSLPNGPLPNRTNIVLTSRPHSLPEGCIAVKSLEEAIACAEADEELFIIGGASVYQQALPLADRLYLTFIHHTFADADTFFPKIDFSQWQQTESEKHEANEKNAFPYSFVDYVRVK